MAWHDLAFLHWALDPSLLRPHVPEGLELDTFDGSAWLGIVPFRMSGVRPFGVPLGGASAFPELNVRTYVTAGGKPGVWFFSLDAASKLAVRAARLWFHLPYFDAAMSCATVGDWIHYRSRRTHRGAAQWVFEGRYRPLGPPSTSEEGSLEAFLTERYCLYAASRTGRLFRGEIDHPPWPLQRAEVELGRCELHSPVTNEALEGDPVAHFAGDLQVDAWTLERLPRAGALP